jgi:hypothetical protein
MFDKLWYGAHSIDSIGTDQSRQWWLRDLILLRVRIDIASSKEGTAGETSDTDKGPV